MATLFVTPSLLSFSGTPGHEFDDEPFVINYIRGYDAEEGEPVRYTCSISYKQAGLFRLCIKYRVRTGWADVILDFGAQGYVKRHPGESSFYAWTLLPEMYQMLYWEDWDCVAARRSDRKGEPRLKSFLSDRFYKVLNKLSKIQLVSGARDYRLMTRRMVKSVLQMSEYNRFSKGLFQWVGFRTAWIEFPNQERCAGKSKWPFRKLISYSLEGITGFSVAPLSLAAVIGLLFCIISFLMIGFIAFRTLIFGDPVRGWPSMACIIFLVGGIQLFCMGILGEYLAKTYLETKHRPIYILKESSGESYKDRSREKNDEKTTDR